jgi:isopentenyl-diphosphate delta-isomerase
MHCRKSNLSDVDTSCEFLGKKLKMPCLSAVRRWRSEAGNSIKALAEAANIAGSALAIGSLRPAFDRSVCGKPRITVARQYAPDIPLIANLGAVQLTEGIDRRV